MAHPRTTTRERVELLADEVIAELYDWPIIEYKGSRIGG